jgi:hypothetical protein
MKRRAKIRPKSGQSATIILKILNTIKSIIKKEEKGRECNGQNGKEKKEKDTQAISIAQLRGFHMSPKNLRMGFCLSSSSAFFPYFAKRGATSDEGNPSTVVLNLARASSVVRALMSIASSFLFSVCFQQDVRRRKEKGSDEVGWECGRCSRKELKKKKRDRKRRERKRVRKGVMYLGVVLGLWVFFFV